MTTRTHDLKPGDILHDSGYFLQVVKATAKMVVVRPIEDRFVGYADEYGWEKEFMPIKDAFTTSPFMSREDAERGKRLKVYDWSQAGDSPEVKLGYHSYRRWVGGPSVLDTYS